MEFDMKGIVFWSRLKFGFSFMIRRTDRPCWLKGNRLSKRVIFIPVNHLLRFLAALTGKKG